MAPRRTMRATTRPWALIVLLAGCDGPTAPAIDGGGTVEGLLFESDWSTATGTDRAAVSDGERWTQVGTNNVHAGVIPADGLDFPTANVLEVVADGHGKVIRYDALPIPGIGESRFYRWYFRVVVPDEFSSDDPNTHPIQDGNAAGQTNWMFNVNFDYAATGVWNMRFSVATPETDWPNYGWEPPTLDKHVTYRIELRVDRVGDDTFQLHPRIYGSDDTLLYDDDDFQNIDRTDTLASTPTFRFRDLANLNGLNSGYNGLGGVTDPMTIYYEGAFCVRSDTWCGPY